eukprot:CAMPEP_0113665456 /NCGR_PEP_ID=MMETSP0038_2-20120614/2316_1 /TAXON_ID=2898 /ORGANISM="Cryptomonas paramecium" /LENGTH=107 /DNA_ID=CAMNT_0000580813 /DNA_START=278 /DNA_END=597 /DNA_ORIENTATION=- /assembly_acc=CAM_ASM_000170
MSKWTPEEVKAIENGGNDKDQAIWLGGWNPSQFPKPSPGDQEKIRKFIQMKYVERRWYVDPEKALANVQSSAPPATTHTPSSAAQVADLLGGMSLGAPRTPGPPAAP